MSNFVDDIGPALDALRQDAIETAGIRPWRVYVVTRTWAGVKRGQPKGQFVDSSLEITPSPRVVSDPTRFRLYPEGRGEDGEIELQAVSLRYTQDQLSPRQLPNNVEHFYLLSDRNSEGLAQRSYVMQGRPSPDRERTIGWILRLKQRSEP